MSDASANQNQPNLVPLAARSASLKPDPQSIIPPLITFRFEYGWRYFNFHATQRTTMFNYFAVFSGFLIKACVDLLEKDYFCTAFMVSLIGLILTFCFLFLERRNEELVHVGEEVLRSVETDLGFDKFIGTANWPMQRNWLGIMDNEKKNVPIGIFTRQDFDESEGRKSKYSHGKWMPLIQLFIAAIFLLMLCVSVYKQTRI